MTLTQAEATEWKYLQKQSHKYSIPVKRIGVNHVDFGSNIHAMLGAGRATAIMNAKTKVRFVRGKRFVTIGSGILSVKVPLKKSPSGKWYMGSATFVNKEYAQGRATYLRDRGEVAWVEGRTVYVRG